MAKRTIIESDLSGEPDAETVIFAFESKRYTVDLTEAEKEAFAKLLAPYIDVAEEAPLTPVQPHVPAQPSGPDPATVRAWAQENGIEVNAKGRVPHSVIAQYEAAQKDSNES